MACQRGQTPRTRDKIDPKIEVQGLNWSNSKLRGESDPHAIVEGRKWLFCQTQKKQRSQFKHVDS